MATKKKQPKKESELQTEAAAELQPQPNGGNAHRG